MKATRQEVYEAMAPPSMKRVKVVTDGAGNCAYYVDGKLFHMNDGTDVVLACLLERLGILAPGQVEFDEFNAEQDAHIVDTGQYPAEMP